MSKIKKSQILEKTTNRREYKILSLIEPWWVYDCAMCPMWSHCSKRKHLICKPNRIRERNWKSQRKTQWK